MSQEPTDAEWLNAIADELEKPSYDDWNASHSRHADRLRSIAARLERPAVEGSVTLQRYAAQFARASNDEPYEHLFETEELARMMLGVAQGRVVPVNVTINPAAAGGV